MSVSVTCRVMRVPDGLRLRRFGELDAEPGFAAGGSTISLEDSTPCRALASLFRIAGMVLLMMFLACFALSSLEELISAPVFVIDRCVQVLMSGC